MLGDTLASFLPGVSITLCQVITGDTKQGQTVIIVSIYCDKRDFTHQNTGTNFFHKN